MGDDACVGSKRRITEENHNEQQQEESFVIISSQKQDSQSSKTSPKKVKCSSFENNDHEIEVSDNKVEEFNSLVKESCNLDCGLDESHEMLCEYDNFCEENSICLLKFETNGSVDIECESEVAMEGVEESNMLDCGLEPSREMLCEKENFGLVLEQSEICFSGVKSESEQNVSVECEAEGNMKGEGQILKEEKGLSGVEKIGEVSEEKSPVVEVEVAKDSVGDGIGSLSAVVENRELKGDRIEAESFLEVKKKHLLAAVEIGAIFTSTPHMNKVIGFPHHAGIDGKENGFQNEVAQHMHKKVQNEANGSGKNALKIQVIDDTALIDSAQSPKRGNGNVKGAGVTGFAKGREQNGKKNEKQDADGMKSKPQRRKGKDAKKRSETSQEHQNLILLQKNVDRTKRTYSREKLEALRFVRVVDQGKSWRSIYTGLAPDVIKEYNTLVASKQKHFSSNFYTQQQFGKRGALSGVLGETSSEIVDNELGDVKDAEMKNINALDPTCVDSSLGKDTHEILEGEWDEDYDSDDYYDSIQRPALFVEGEPDFDSGPPEDGLEYLRRVRWEAAQCLKVTVAKLDKPVKEQCVYMPQIPEIARCPEHLLPLKQWEDEFLADFSELRLALSGFSNSNGENTGKLQSVSVLHEKSSSHIPENIILEKLKNLKTDDVHPNQPINVSNSESCQSSVSDAKNVKCSEFLENPSPRASVNDTSFDYPMLSVVIKMSPVSRVSMLRKRINSLETMRTLSKGDCTWLFALCAAVDTPLDADTCAAIRGLLRKCASLRAEKSEVDDELVMLNILATIAGKYFGQSEN